MSERKPNDASTQDRLAEVAQEIFVRDRGTNREIPFNDFLTRVERAAHEQVREERRRKPRPQVP